MNSLVVSSHTSSFRTFPHSSSTQSFNLFPNLRQPTFLNFHFFSSKFKPPHFIACCSSGSSPNRSNPSEESILQNDIFHAEVTTPNVPSFASPVSKFSFTDQAFFLITFIACTTSVTFTSLVFAAVPTLFAMRNAAISLSKLADTAREELPSTMAAIRLSGMEISDLTLELSDLSQEIADGVNKSAQALQAAEAGIKQIGSMAQEQTMSMIEERANLPIISLQPVVVGAARKTSRAVGRATKSLMNIISGKEGTSEYDDDDNGRNYM
ncbi:uncharacterized protein LOC130747818 [Lotus japonicus]|uniref:Transmembrane protein n=1 Tax=Lotus japonicus TaxID=34305 RepID=I3T3F8_LOTJA|nr:uncharacterized protein LOC130747818 [Lotus japonicus]AFK47050.1 unknown [Lotus japonicus]